MISVIRNYKYAGPGVTIPPPGVLPYMGYIGMCGPKGYGFSAVLVIDRVSILANFVHFGHKWCMVCTLALIWACF